MKSIELAFGTEVLVPDELHQEALQTLQSYRQIGQKLPEEQHVFRFVDLGAGEGTFAAFAAFRWPYAYLDCYESRPEYAKVLRLNAQAGTRFLPEFPQFVPPCDALHIGAHLKGIQFNGPDLAQLKVCLWDFADDETFENSAGLMRTIGMRLAHVAMIDQGPPVRGWQLWIRERDSVAPEFKFDLTSEYAKRKLAEQDEIATAREALDRARWDG